MVKNVYQIIILKEYLKICEHTQCNNVIFLSISNLSTSSAQFNYASWSRAFDNSARHSLKTQDLQYQIYIHNNLLYVNYTVVKIHVFNITI